MEQIPFRFLFVSVVDKYEWDDFPVTFEKLLFDGFELLES